MAEKYEKQRTHVYSWGIFLQSPVFYKTTRYIFFLYYKNYTTNELMSSFAGYYPGDYYLIRFIIEFQSVVLMC